MAADWTLKQGDTTPPIAAELRERPGRGERYGAPANLSNIEGVWAVFRLPCETVVAEAEVLNAFSGQVGVDPPAAVTAVPGVHPVEWKVNEAGHRRTYPASGDAAQHLLVRRTAPTTLADGGSVLGTIGVVSMAGSATDGLLDSFLNHAVINTAMASPAGVWAQLHLADPGSDGMLSPAVETARQQVTFATPTARATANTNDVTWPSVAAAETYRAISLWSDQAGGVPLYTAVFSAPIQVLAGSQFTILGGDITIAHGAALTTWLANAMLEHVLLGTPMTQPGGLWVQLHDGDPGLAATANVAGTNTRAAIADLTDANNGLVSNVGEIEWATAAVTEIASHVSVWDAATGGNPMWQGAISPKGLTAGAPITIASGQLILGIQ